MTREITYLLAPSRSIGEAIMQEAGLSRRGTVCITQGDQLRGLHGITLYQVAGPLPQRLSDEVAWQERHGRVTVVEGLPPHARTAPDVQADLNLAVQTIIDLVQHFGGHVGEDWSSFRVGFGYGMCRGIGATPAQQIISATREALTLAPLVTEGRPQDRSARVLSVEDTPVPTSQIAERAKRMLVPALHPVVDARTAAGFHKYGQVLDDNPGDASAKAVHLLQELLDALQYNLWGATTGTLGQYLSAQLAGAANAVVLEHPQLDLPTMLHKEGHSGAGT